MPVDSERVRWEAETRRYMGGVGSANLDYLASSRLIGDPASKNKNKNKVEGTRGLTAEVII